MGIQKRVRAVALGALLVCGFSSGAGAVSILFGQVHTVDVTKLATFGGHSLTSNFVQNDAGWASALGGGLGAFGAIVLSHPTGPSSLSGGTIASIAAYVSGGGRLIVGGDHGVDEANFLNTVFGYSTLPGGTPSDITKTAAAAGTSFAGAPATLPTISATNSLTNAPRFIMYTASSGAAVVTIDSFGTGIVGFYGWDFFNGSTSSADGWYSVLDASLTYNAAAVPEPAALTLFGLGLLGLGAARRRRKNG